MLVDIAVSSAYSEISSRDSISSAAFGLRTTLELSALITAQHSQGRCARASTPTLLGREVP